MKGLGAHRKLRMAVFGTGSRCPHKMKANGFAFPVKPSAYFAA